MIDRFELFLDLNYFRPIAVILLLLYCCLNGWGGGSKLKVTENQVLTVYFQFQIIHKMIKSEAGYFPTITGYSELS